MLYKRLSVHQGPQVEEPAWPVAPGVRLLKHAEEMKPRVVQQRQSPARPALLLLLLLLHVPSGSVEYCSAFAL